MGRADSLQGAGRDCGLVGCHQTGGDGAPGSLWRTCHPLPREAEVPLASFPPWSDQGSAKGVGAAESREDSIGGSQEWG